MFNPRTSSLQFVLPFILACLCSAALANKAQISNHEEERAVLDQILAKYDVRIRPSGINGTDGPVEVRVNMFVKSIPNFDDDKQEYSVILIFRERWVDERLKFDYIGGEDKSSFDIETEARLHSSYLSLSSAERIWMPDTFFSNEKRSHSHNMLKPNEYVRIYPKGEVLYSTRISLTLDCFMNFKLYPFDRQDCQLRFAPYGSTTKDVVFLWTEGDPVQMSRGQELRGFTLEDYSSDDCSSSNGISKFSCLKVNFSFKRNLMSSLIRIYIPCCVLVFASFVSFWLDRDAVTARVLLGVATLLAMVFQVSNISSSLPPVYYIKAVDIWTVVCLIFIFATLLEFATLNYCSRYDIKRKCEQVTLNGIHNESEESKTWLSKFSGSKKIDIVSRITFPVLFALFNLIYWITYLSTS